MEHNGIVSAAEASKRTHRVAHVASQDIDLYREHSYAWSEIKLIYLSSVIWPC